MKTSDFADVAKTNPIKPNTKPIQTQNKPNLLDSQMNVNKVLTKDYENDNAFRPHENKPNLSRRSLWRSRNKPNFPKNQHPSQK